MRGVGSCAGTRVCAVAMAAPQSEVGLVPGPAGRLQALLRRGGAAPADIQELGWRDGSRGHGGSGGSDVLGGSRACEQHPTWRAAQRSLGPGFSRVLISSAKEAQSCKVSGLLVVLDELVVSVDGNAFAVVKDSSGLLDAVVHQRVFPVKPNLAVGALVALQHVTLVRMPDVQYLCVTLDNIVEVFSPPVEHACARVGTTLQSSGREELQSFTAGASPVVQSFGGLNSGGHPLGANLSPGITSCRSNGASAGGLCGRVGEGAPDADAPPPPPVVRSWRVGVGSAAQDRCSPAGAAPGGMGTPRPGASGAHGEAPVQAPPWAASPAVEVMDVSTGGDGGLHGRYRWRDESAAMNAQAPLRNVTNEGKSSHAHTSTKPRSPLRHQSNPVSRNVREVTGRGNPPQPLVPNWTRPQSASVKASVLQELLAEEAPTLDDLI